MEGTQDEDDDDDDGDDDDDDDDDANDDYDVDYDDDDYDDDDDDDAAAAAAAADDGDDDNDEVDGDYDVDYDHHPQSYCCLGREKNALTGCQVLQLFEIILGIEQKQWFVWILLNMLQSVTEIQINEILSCRHLFGMFGSFFLRKTIHSLSSPVVYLQMMVLILSMHKFSI